MPLTCHVLCVVAETDSTVRRCGHMDRVSEQVAGVLGKAQQHCQSYWFLRGRLSNSYNMGSTIIK